MSKVKKQVKNFKKKLTKEELEELALQIQVNDVVAQANSEAIALDTSSLPHYADASGGVVTAGSLLLGAGGTGLSTGAMLGIGALAIGGIAIAGGGGGGSTDSGVLGLDLGGEGRVTTDFQGQYDDGEYVMTTGVNGQFMVAGNVYTGSDYELGIAKYNSDGTLDTTFGGGDGKMTINDSSVNDARGIIIDDNGNVIISGYYYNGGNYDFAIAKYDSNGVLIFSNTTDFYSSYDYSYDVAVDSEGGIISVGQVYNSSTNYYDFGVVKYNSTGGLDTTFGGGDGKLTTDFSNQYEYATSVTVDANDNIIVAGYVSNSSGDFAVVKYDNDGNEIFKTMTDFNNNSDYPNSVTVDSEGNIIVVGYVYNSDSSNTDFGVVKYSGVDGSVIFQTTVDFNNNYDYAYDVVVDVNDNIIVSGYARDNDSYDFAIAKLDSDGNFIGKTTTDFGGRDYGRSIALDEDGNIIVAGGVEIYSTNNYDFAIAKYDSNGILVENFGNYSHANNESPLAWEADLTIGANADLGGDTFTLQRSNGSNIDDVFSSDMIVGSDVMQGFLDIGDVSQNSNGTLRVTFDSDATEVGVEEFLQSIEYQNLNSAVFEQTVVLNWTYNDGASSISVLQNVYIDGVVI